MIVVHLNPSVHAHAVLFSSPVNPAVWNCVFYNIKVYQNSILNDLPSLISVAQEKIEPHKNIAATAIYARLEAAMKVNESSAGLAHIAGSCCS